MRRILRGERDLLKPSLWWKGGRKLTNKSEEEKCEEKS